MATQHVGLALWLGHRVTCHKLYLFPAYLVELSLVLGSPLSTHGAKSCLHSTAPTCSTVPGGTLSRSWWSLTNPCHANDGHAQPFVTFEALALLAASFYMSNGFLNFDNLTIVDLMKPEEMLLPACTDIETCSLVGQSNFFLNWQLGHDTPNYSSLKVRRHSEQY